MCPLPAFLLCVDSFGELRAFVGIPVSSMPIQAVVASGWSARAYPSSTGPWMIATAARSRAGWSTARAVSGAPSSGASADSATPAQRTRAGGGALRTGVRTRARRGCRGRTRLRRAGKLVSLADGRGQRGLCRRVARFGVGHSGRVGVEGVCEGVSGSGQLDSQYRGPLDGSCPLGESGSLAGLGGLGGLTV